MKKYSFRKLTALLLTAVLTVSVFSMPAAAEEIQPAARGAQMEAVVPGDRIDTPASAKAEQKEAVGSVKAAGPTIRPIFSKTSGTYLGYAAVTISTRKGYEIYYTYDGSMPTVNSRHYTKPLKITRSCTLTAVAIRGKTVSAAKTAKFVIQVKQPGFSVEGGYYDKAQTVTLKPMDSRTVIHYTTDGSTPTINTPRYTKPITVSKYTILRARAYRQGCLKSDIATQEYAIYRPATSDSKKCHFAWNDGINDWNWDMEIRKADYAAYRKKINKFDAYNYDYAAYVRDSSDNAYMASLAESMVSAGKAEGYTDEQIINMMLTFVQTIPYVTDWESAGQVEFPKYPIVTLYENEGDCEDTAILLCALLKGAGYDCMMLDYDPRPGEDSGHMAVGVVGNFSGTYYNYNGKQYFYAETTNTGWAVGEIPDGYDYATFLLVD